MRLTLALRMPQMRGRLKDASWQRWRTCAIEDTGMEKKLRDSGIAVIDANEFVQEQDKNLYPPDWRALADPEPLFPNVPKNDRTHPDWHDKPRLVYDMSSFPIEGVKQAQVFTKCVQIKKGLPDDLMNRSNAINFKNQDDTIQRVVKQAFLWDAYLDVLPNLRHRDFPSHKFRREFGTPAKRSNEILLRNFLRLIESKVPEIATTRVVTAEEEFRVNFDRHGESVQFKLSPLSNIMSKKPVINVLSGDLVQYTVGVEIPDIFPFLSTANIEDINIYKQDDHFAFKSESSFPYIHTAVFSHHIPGSHTHIHPRWNDDRFSGSTIMYSFAVALLMARRMYGSDVTKLPHPVTSQVVHLTGKEFQFSVFQLNTLDMEDSSESKVKNIVWLTDKISLFSRIENELGKETFEGYNPEVFKILAGMYLTKTS